jgi:uncharacterized protein DUF3631
MTATVLEDARTFIHRFVVLDDHQAVAAALWAAHTHVHDAFGITPYLATTSAEKRSGKTRFLEVLELLVREPLPTANISDAALFRVIAAKAPTLLMDEVDAIFRSREREELRGLLNAGYRRGAVAHRMGGATNRTLETFAVFCPKAFAGIGDCLSDTIKDRSIPIRLKRRTRDEQVERYRLRDVEPEGHDLRDRLADWLEPQHDYIAASRPALPDELDDRAQDCWEPLLAIADLAGWSDRARRAAVALSTGEERDDDSHTVVLLRDINAYFSGNGHDRVKTADLLAYLHAIEDSPWGDWYGKTLSAHGLSRLLRSYRIQTMPVRVDGATVRGYKAEQFADAFARALSVTGVTSVTSQSASQKGSNASNASNAYPSEAADEDIDFGPDDDIDFGAALKEDGRRKEALLAPYWLCPCGQDEPKTLGGAKPVETRVSLREPRCPFCKRKYLPEYRPQIDEKGIGRE